MSEAVSDWIDCNDRLPTPGEAVLAFSPNFQPVGHAVLRMWRADGPPWWADLTGRRVGFVSHWMPLPAPPPRPEWAP